MTSKKFNVNWLFLLVPLFIIIGIIAYLSNETCYKPMNSDVLYCITGWETLAIQKFWFWAWVIIGTSIGILLLRKAYITEQEGRKTGTVITLVIIGVLLIVTPWGKACTDKANGGVTAPGYKNKALPDSTKQASYFIYRNQQRRV